ncbi:MAG: hypothetical protein ACK5VZ_05725 [Alphaproteobacteria bacterium]|jgi:hypothetical protein
MAFSSRRGRPKAVRPQTDFGTIELQQKRAVGLTSEPIDLCLDRRIITPTQHWCGLHLRWLYTLRYGAPAVSSSWRTLHDNFTIRPDDPEWRSAREQEFAQAAQLLRRKGCYQVLMGLVIFNERPRFLEPHQHRAALENSALMQSMTQEYEQVLEGFELLETLWKEPRLESNSVTFQPQNELY